MQCTFILLAFYNYPLFTSKPTFARIDFLRPCRRLAKKKAAIMLKFALKILQIQSKTRELGSKGTS